MFVKAKEPRSSHTVLKELYFDAPTKTLKSHIVCDSSYLNWAFIEETMHQLMKTNFRENIGSYVVSSVY